MAKIRHERSIDIEFSILDLRDRLESWANRRGYGFWTARGRRWIYRRGDWWSARGSFDIRAYPTELVVEFDENDHRRARLSLECDIGLAPPLPGDSEKLEDDLDLLVAFLCERNPTRFRIHPADVVR